MNPLLDPYEREPEEHQCQCWLCAPRAFPKIPDRQTDAYVGVGHPFGRRVPPWARPEYQFTLWFNGTVIWPAERWITEVLAGPLGWIVWMYPPGKDAPGGTHARDEEGWPICQCQMLRNAPGSPCMQISYGNISMEEQHDNPFAKHPSGQNLLFSANAPINRIYWPMTNVLGGHAVDSYDALVTTKTKPEFAHPLWWREAKARNWEF